jgi:hypothetical protein
MKRWRQRAKQWLKKNGLCDFRGAIDPALIKDLAKTFERIEARLTEDSVTSLRSMLAELEFVGGDDMSDPSCHFCTAVGPHGSPDYVKYRPAEAHDAQCPLALALGLPMMIDKEGE